METTRILITSTKLTTLVFFDAVRAYMRVLRSMIMPSSTEVEGGGIGGLIAKIVRVLAVLGVVFIALFIIQVVLTHFGYTTTGSAGFLLGVSTAILFLPLVGYLFELIRDAWGGLSD